MLNIAGSLNYRGAAYLSSITALRAGAGYVTLASVEPVINAVSALTPDLVFVPLKSNGPCIASSEFEKVAHRISLGTVVSLGCGLSGIDRDRKDIRLFVWKLLEELARRNTTTVLDADGLNLLSEMGTLPVLPKHLVMTPHPKELSRLLKLDVPGIQKDRGLAAKIAANRFGGIVLLKGHDTVISDGEKVVVNDTGNSALAKAGTGDVLTGVIAGLLAQGVPPFDAAVLAARIHGLAGELASKEFSEYGVLASDLPKYVSLAIKALQ
ncbi:MAG: NAD(P)H-hydrate dehydratase [Fibrobacteraceae bacterium]|nr:NAD(P)H-hydrate dehydratase [Fibrobacteraceae bacterium]